MTPSSVGDGMGTDRGMDVIALNTGPPVDTDAALIAGVRGSMPLDNAPLAETTIGLYKTECIPPGGRTHIGSRALMLGL